VLSLHVEYAERGNEYGLLFIFSPFYEYTNLEYEHVPLEYRVHQAEYGIHVCVTASQEYVNTYSTRRVLSCDFSVQGELTSTGDPWPLHDIAITNISWCMAQKGAVGKRAYIAQWSCNSIAIGKALQVEGGQYKDDGLPQ